MSKTLIANATLVNEGKTRFSDVLIDGETIAAISPNLAEDPRSVGANRIDGTGHWLMPGCIDDQVHFREPGLTHKAEIATESAAAAAGGITSFMEMPNTIPQALTQDLLQDKYDRAAEVSAVNYSFFMGASNSNIAEVLKTDPKNVCGIKVFMGSSTGNMLVDDRETLKTIFCEAPTLLATHCEDEETIRRNLAAAKATYGDEVPMDQHPLIRSAEACYKSSSLAVELAEKCQTRLHILHISTARELTLFRNDIPLRDKKITAEACIHHLTFCDADYPEKGALIKWNPAVKRAEDREAIREAIRNGTIDVVATDHAPHTLAEKSQSYFQAPSGGPLVQHALVAMLELVHNGRLELTDVPRLMAHQVAELFDIRDRGYIRVGQAADLVLVNPNSPWQVERDGLRYKCGWSPFEGRYFQSRVEKTWVNGQLVFDGERVHLGAAKRLTFDR